MVYVLKIMQNWSFHSCRGRLRNLMIQIYNAREELLVYIDDCLITSMIEDRIKISKIVIPINLRSGKIWSKKLWYRSLITINYLFEIQRRKVLVKIFFHRIYKEGIVSHHKKARGTQVSSSHTLLLEIWAAWASNDVCGRWN